MTVTMVTKYQRYLISQSLTRPPLATTGPDVSGCDAAECHRWPTSVTPCGGGCSRLIKMCEQPNCGCQLRIQGSVSRGYSGVSSWSHRPRMETDGTFKEGHGKGFEEGTFTKRWAELKKPRKAGSLRASSSKKPLPPGEQGKVPEPDESCGLGKDRPPLTSAEWRKNEE